MAFLKKAAQAAKAPEGSPEEEAAESPQEEQQEQDSGQGDADDSQDSGSDSDEGADTDTLGTDPAEEGGPDKPSDENSGEDKLTPQQQQEYKKFLTALYIVLYKNEQTSRTILNMIQPQDKIGSLSKTAVILLHQLDKKVNIDPSVMPFCIIAVVDRLIELATRAKKITFAKPEVTQVMNAVVAGAKKLFGGPQGGAAPPGGPPGAPGAAAPGGPPAGPAPGGAPPPGGPPPGGVPGGNTPSGTGPGGALAQGASAMASQGSGMPPPPQPVPGAAPPQGGQ